MPANVGSVFRINHGNVVITGDGAHTPGSSSAFMSMYQPSLSRMRVFDKTWFIQPRVQHAGHDMAERYNSM